MAYEKFVKKVPGKNAGDIFIYALSTCGWCKKTKNLLSSLGLEYSFVDVDQLSGLAKEEAAAEMTKYNPNGSFPTIILNKKECIVGFQEDRLREVAKVGR